MGSRKRIINLISIENAVQRNFIWLGSCTTISLTDLWQLKILIVITKDILGNTEFLGIVVLTI